MTTFQLPNLVSRAPCGAGQSPGNSRRVVGQTFGSNSVSLQTADMPMHTHVIDDYQPEAASQLAAVPVATAGIGYPVKGTFTPFLAPGAAATMDPNAIGTVGSGNPHENRQPFLALNYSVALIGVYPSFG